MKDKTEKENQSINELLAWMKNLGLISQAVVYCKKLIDLNIYNIDDFYRAVILNQTLTLDQLGVRNQIEKDKLLTGLNNFERSTVRTNSFTYFYQSN